MKRSLVCLFVAAQAAGAQPAKVIAHKDSVPPDSAVQLAVERLALRAALDWGTFARPARIVINPQVVLKGSVPVIVSSEPRLPWRNEALIAFFGAKSGMRDSVVLCPAATAPDCSLQNADVYATLAQPRIMGRRAQLQVTLERARTPRGVTPVSLVVDMSGEGTAWVVSRIYLLGEH